MQEETSPPTDWANRRRFLKALGALGMSGLAGCGGDDSDTLTDTTEPGETTEPKDTTEPVDESEPVETTEPDGETPTETGTPTETTTPTETPGQPLEDPAQLLEFGSSPLLKAGETATLSGTLTNVYLFPVQNVDVTIDSPGENWSISPTGKTSFESLASQGSQEIGWEITPPEDANGEYTLNATVSYESTTDAANVSVSASLMVLTPGEAPQAGLEAYFPLDGDTAVNQVTDTEAEVIGDPSSGAEGILGTAWGFTADDSFDTVADGLASGDPLPINGQEATIAAWFRAESHPDTTEAFARILQVGGTVTEGSQLIEILFRGGDNANAFNLWTGSDSPTFSISPGTWYFVVGVADGSEGTLYVFDQTGELDGSPVTTGDEREQTGDEPLVMMAGDGREVAGLLDEVRAYSRALPREEVLALYAGSGGAA